MIAFEESLAHLHPEIETKLDSILPAENEHPERIHRAMRYSVFAGGKRIRPGLVVLIGETLDAEREALLSCGAATELFHTYSLIHDDLPAMDDDDLRRGLPSLHRHYDEATAILAGDGLLTLGFAILADLPPALSAEDSLRAARRMAEALGTRGMIGGQIDDLAAEGRWPGDAAEALDAIHDRKTGALLAACCQLAGIVARVDDEVLAKLERIGFLLGRMFQIGDDILDREGSQLTLGKTVGKDDRSHKLTYPALHGMRGSRERLKILGDETMALAANLPGGDAFWSSLVRFFSSRDH